MDVGGLPEDGSGGFSSGTAIGPSADKTRSMGLADVDGDGDLDLLVGNSGQPNRLYLSNGSGVFSSFTNKVSLSGVDATKSVAAIALDMYPALFAICDAFCNLVPVSANFLFR